MPHPAPSTTSTPVPGTQATARPEARRPAAATRLGLEAALCALGLVAAAVPALAADPPSDPTGHYRTADGREVRVFGINGALFAVVGRGSALRLLPDGDGQHVSADGRLRLRLVSGPAGTGSAALRPVAAAPMPDR